MNLTQVHRLTGTAEEAGDVLWASDPEATTEIKVNGGLYLLLFSFELAQNSFDEDGYFYAELPAASDVGPKIFEYYAPEHRHKYTGLTAPTDRVSDYGDRLIYQDPMQWWSWGDIPEMQLTLFVSGPCSVTLIASKIANISDLDPLDMVLR